MTAVPRDFIALRNSGVITRVPGGREMNPFDLPRANHLLRVRLPKGDVGHGKSRVSLPSRENIRGRLGGLDEVVRRSASLDSAMASGGKLALVQMVNEVML